MLVASSIASYASCGCFVHRALTKISHHIACDDWGVVNT